MSNTHIVRNINKTLVTAFVGIEQYDENNNLNGFETVSYEITFNKPLNTAKDMRRAVKSRLKTDNFTVFQYAYTTEHYEMDIDKFYELAKPMSEYPAELVNYVRFVKARKGTVIAQIVTPETLATPVTIKYPTDIKQRALKKLISDEVGTSNYMVISSIEQTTEYGLPIDVFMKHATTDETTDDTTDETTDDTTDEN